MKIFVSEPHLDESDFARVWVDAEIISADRVKQLRTLRILNAVDDYGTIMKMVKILQDVKKNKDR